jgi:hypothetical protein
MKDEEAVEAPVRGMVEFNKTRLIPPSFLRKPDPDYFVFALCFNSNLFADKTEILYVGPVLEKCTCESDLPAKLAGVNFDPPKGYDSSNNELFSDDDDVLLLLGMRIENGTNIQLFSGLLSGKLSNIWNTRLFVSKSMVLML